MVFLFKLNNMITLNDAISVSAPRNTDAKKDVFENGVSRPFNSISEFLDRHPLPERYEGQEVPVRSASGGIDVYWSVGGIGNSSYVPKIQSSMVLSSSVFDGTSEGYIISGDILHNVYSNKTWLPETYTRVTKWHDGTAMTDAKIDPVIYRRLSRNGVVSYWKLEVYKKRLDVRYYGVVADWDGITGTNNTESFLSAGTACGVFGLDMYLPKGSYFTNKFGRYNNIDIVGDSAYIFLKYSSSLSVVMVQFGSNTRVFGVVFWSLETDLANQRCGVEQADNVFLRRCGFVNFKNPTQSNSWGTYMKNASNVTLDNCWYRGNTQSDIAVLENCTNILIINPINVVDGGVYLNVEPNGLVPVAGMVVIGGIYRRLTTIINVFTGEPIVNMVVNGGVVSNYRHRGAQVKFNGTRILNIDTGDSEYLGDFDMQLRLGENVFKDPYLYDVEFNNQSRQWTNPTPNVGTFRVDRTGKDYTTINFENTAQTSVVTHPNTIPASTSKLYFISFTGSATYLADTAQISRCADLRFYDAAGVLVKTMVLSFFRFKTATAGTTGIKTESGFFRLPEGAVSFKLYLGNNNSSSKSIDFKFISINEVLELNTGEYISDYVARHMPKGRYKFLAPYESTSPLLTAGGKIGDIVDVFTPVDKKASSYVLVNETKPAKYEPIAFVNSDNSKAKRGSNANRPSGVSQGFSYYSTDFFRPYYYDEVNGYIPFVPPATTGQSGTVNKVAVLTATVPPATAPTVYDATYAKQTRDLIVNLITGMQAANQLSVPAP